MAYPEIDKEEGRYPPRIKYIQLQRLCGLFSSIKDGCEKYRHALDCMFSICCRQQCIMNIGLYLILNKNNIQTIYTQLRNTNRKRYIAIRTKQIMRGQQKRANI